jgi:hypothetical protein
MATAVGDQPEGEAGQPVDHDDHEVRCGLADEGLLDFAAGWKQGRGSLLQLRNGGQSAAVNSVQARTEADGKPLRKAT